MLFGIVPQAGPATLVCTAHAADSMAISADFWPGVQYTNRRAAEPSSRERSGSVRSRVTPVAIDRLPGSTTRIRNGIRRKDEMLKIKEIAATLAILGSGALAVSACNKDKQATETPEAAGGGDAAGAEAADGEKAEGSCGGAAEGSCGGDKAEGEGEKAEGSCGGAKGEGSCGGAKGEGSCGGAEKEGGG
jgi:hypothetical protein